MKIAVYGRNVEQSVDKYTFIINKLQKSGFDICLYSEFSVFLEMHKKLFTDISTFSTDIELLNNVDFLVSLGGDGTFLEATKFVCRNNIPIVGINTGSLGFLANIATYEMDPAIEEIVTCKYTVESRSLIEVSFGAEKNLPHALNEIGLQRINPSLISISVSINGELLSQYWSDGLILATPTGSTAYSLSVGGPIVVPTASNFIISPIAPHNLAIRPIVIPDDVEISLKLQTREGENAKLSVDNQMFDVISGSEIKAKKSPFCVKIIKPNSVNFYKILRNKLMWGYDIRNSINVSKYYI